VSDVQAERKRTGGIVLGMNQKGNQGRCQSAKWQHMQNPAGSCC